RRFRRTFPAWTWGSLSDDPSPWEVLPWWPYSSLCLMGKERCTWVFRLKVPISPLTSLEVLLFNPDPGAYLPHRFPFLLLDRILSLEPGISAVARQQVTSGASDFPQF